MSINFPENQVTAVILGVMQDGGLPHIGCHCTACAAARQDPACKEYVTSLGIVDTRPDKTAVWLLDATPDINYQLDLLAEALGPHPKRPYRLRQPDGICLTHAHIGHINGLTYLGPEAMAVHRMPVYAGVGLVALLRETRLWKPLSRSLEFIPLSSKSPVMLAPDLSVTPVPVPHRDEWGIGTFAFHVKGPERSLLYVPDIDDWEQWRSARTHLNSVDYAIVDATFYQSGELVGREPVPHPPVVKTLELFHDVACQLVLTHFNHTNPLLLPDSPAQQTVQEAGVQLAYTGRQFAL